MGRDRRRSPITTADIDAKRRELEELQRELEKQDCEKVASAVKLAGVDLGHFSDAQLAEALKSLAPTFSSAVAEGVPAGARQARVVAPKKEKVHADG